MLGIDISGGLKGLLRLRLAAELHAGSAEALVEVTLCLAVAVSQKGYSLFVSLGGVAVLLICVVHIRQIKCHIISILLYLEDLLEERNGVLRTLEVTIRYCQLIQPIRIPLFLDDRLQSGSGEIRLAHAIVGSRHKKSELKVILVSQQVLR